MIYHHFTLQDVDHRRATVDFLGGISSSFHDSSGGLWHDRRRVWGDYFKMKTVNNKEIINALFVIDWVSGNDEFWVRQEPTHNEYSLREIKSVNL